MTDARQARGPYTDVLHKRGSFGLISTAYLFNLL
jgi:hypothetical protein